MTPEQLERVRSLVEGDKNTRWSAEEGQWHAAAELLLEYVDDLRDSLRISCSEWKGWLDAAKNSGWPHDETGERFKLRKCQLVLADTHKEAFNG